MTASPVERLSHQLGLAARCADVDDAGAARLIGELAAAHGPVAADLALAELLGRTPRALPAVLDLVGTWRGARGPLAAWGGLSPDERISAGRAAAALRASLRPLIAPGRVAGHALALRHELSAIYLWDRLFLDPLSVANVGAPAGHAGAEIDPLVDSIDRPMPPRVDEPGLLWRSPRPALDKLLIALWLINVPPNAVTAADRDRFAAHAEALCELAPPLPLPVAAPLTHALLVGAFRASYAGGDTSPVLAAIGRFAAASVQRAFPAWAEPPPSPPPADRIRLGYVTAFAHRHAVSSYMANRILHRDRDRFHVTVFALDDRRDDLTAELEASADAFVRLPPRAPIDAVARAIAGVELDLLVHAALGMELATYLIAGLRLAPVQVALMGHATSSGLPTIDAYVSGDHEPPGAQAHYVERLITLPDLGAAQRPPPSGGRTWTRADLGVPDDAIVLMNLGHGLKHGPERDPLYAEILARVPRAWLVLKPFFGPGDVDPRLLERLCTISPRVVVLPPVARARDVQGLLALADVQLDTFPFGGWTTNLEALHAGVPIVTQEGATGRERWGARFLDLLQIRAGRAADARGYVEEAVGLADDDALRRDTAARIRARIARFFDGAAAQPAYEAALVDLLGRR